MNCRADTRCPRRRRIGDDNRFAARYANGIVARRRGPERPSAPEAAIATARQGPRERPKPAHPGGPLARRSPARARSVSSICKADKGRPFPEADRRAPRSSRDHLANFADSICIVRVKDRARRRRRDERAPRPASTSATSPGTEPRDRRTSSSDPVAAPVRFRGSSSPRERHRQTKVARRPATSRPPRSKGPFVELMRRDPRNARRERASRREKGRPTTPRREASSERIEAARGARSSSTRSARSRFKRRASYQLLQSRRYLTPRETGARSRPIVRVVAATTRASRTRGRSEALHAKISSIA